MKQILWLVLSLSFTLTLPSQTAFAAIAKQKTETVSHSEPSGVASKTIKKEKKGQSWLAKKMAGWKARFEKLRQKFDLGIRSKYLKLSLILLPLSIIFFVVASFTVLGVLFNVLGSIAIIGAMVFLVLWLLEKNRNK